MTTKYIALMATIVAAKAEYNNEYVVLPGNTKENHIISPLPHTYIEDDDLPDSWNWNDVDGKSCLTHMLNQHIPQYCGSCWAHASISSLADRIKIAQNCEGNDINLSIQFVLNCSADVGGSCHGGSHTGVHQFIHEYGYIPYDTCMPYIACSDDSDEGFCEQVDTTCSPINTCRTCSGFQVSGGECTALDAFPYATIAEYGVIGGYDDRVIKIKKEIYARGPVSASINSKPLHDYMGGVFNDDTASKHCNHVVSIVGWDRDDDDVEYWIIRNSWGSYWGEEGFFRVATGSNMLGLEHKVAWSTPGKFTITNTPCTMGGTCKDVSNSGFQEYVDPSMLYLAKNVDATN